MLISKIQIIKVGGIIFLQLLFLNLNGCKTKLELGGNYAIEYDSIALDQHTLSRYYDFQIFEPIKDSIILVGYNHNRHSIDIFDITHRKIIRTFQLSRDGPDKIGDVSGLSCTNRGLLVDHESRLSFLESEPNYINYQDKILDTLIRQKRYQFKKPIFVNRHGSLAADVTGKKVALPAYSLDFLYENGTYDDSHLIGLIDLERQSAEFNTTQFPENFEKNKFYGDLDDLLLSFKSESELIYAYRLSSEFWILNLETGTTHKSMDIPDNIRVPPKSINRSDFIGSKRKNHLAQSATFFGVRYDLHKDQYVRSYKLETSGTLMNDDSNNHFMIFDRNARFSNSWQLDSLIIPNLFPLKSGIFALCRANSDDYLIFAKITVEE